MLLIADRKLTDVPVHECHEPIINIIYQSIISWGPPAEAEDNTDYTKMRKSVYEMLVQAQKRLPSELKLCLYEGYRTIALQKMLFDNRYALIKSLHPDWTHEAVYTESTRLVAPVQRLDGTKTVPPHSTGGAVDVYLVDRNGQAVEMGIHPKDWMEDTDGSISRTISDVISPIAQENRRILSHAMASAGFVNYTEEYWHWSYGDKYWAYHTRQPHAIYNSV